MKWQAFFYYSTLYAIKIIPHQHATDAVMEVVNAEVVNFFLWKKRPLKIGVRPRHLYL